MPSESSKLSAFQLASILASYAGAVGYGTPYQYLAEKLEDSAKGSIMAQAQLIAQKRAKPKGIKKILSTVSPFIPFISAFMGNNQQPQYVPITDISPVYSRKIQSNPFYYNPFEDPYSPLYYRNLK